MLIPKWSRWRRDLLAGLIACVFLGAVMSVWAWARARGAEAQAQEARQRAVEAMKHAAERQTDRR